MNGEEMHAPCDSEGDSRLPVHASAVLERFGVERADAWEDQGAALSRQRRLRRWATGVVVAGLVAGSVAGYRAEGRASVHAGVDGDSSNVVESWEYAQDGQEISFEPIDGYDYIEFFRILN